MINWRPVTSCQSYINERQVPSVAADPRGYGQSCPTFEGHWTSGQEKTTNRGPCSICHNIKVINQTITLLNKMFFFPPTLTNMLSNDLAGQVEL